MLIEIAKKNTREKRAERSRKSIKRTQKKNGGEVEMSSTTIAAGSISNQVERAKQLDRTRVNSLGDRPSLRIFLQLAQIIEKTDGNGFSEVFRSRFLVLFDCVWPWRFWKGRSSS